MKKIPGSDVICPNGVISTRRDTSFTDSSFETTVEVRFEYTVGITFK